MAHWLFLPEDAIEDIRALANLSAEKIGAFRSMLESRGMKHRNQFYVQVGEALGMGDEPTAGLCSFISYVQSQLKRVPQPPATVVDEMIYFLERNKEVTIEERNKLIASINERRGPLDHLFVRLKNYEIAIKKTNLETGPLPHLHELRTYCDLRPVYDEEANTILEMFPLITLHLTYHSTTKEDSEEICVQISESDVDDIKKQLDRLASKLKLLKASDAKINTGESGK